MSSGNPFFAALVAEASSGDSPDARMRQPPAAGPEERGHSRQAQDGPARLLHPGCP